MRLIPSVAISLLAVTFCLVPAAAQTTGVPGINDYTITCVGCATGSPPGCGGAPGGLGGVSGSMSCTTLVFDMTIGGTLNFSVSCFPGQPVQIFFNLCPCSPCFFPLPPAFCAAIPFTACASTTNQSVDLNLTCPLSSLGSGTANTAGIYSFSIPIPPLPPNTCIRVATQALVTGIPGTCSFPFVVTQAYNVWLSS